jgi:hypothetical protein
MGVANWIKLAQDRVQWLALVNNVMKLWEILRTGEGLKTFPEISYTI